MVSKLKIFVSHITEEAKIASALKAFLEKSFSGDVEVFVSSHIDGIPAGTVWLDTIRNAIETAGVIIVLCSPASVQKPWVQFEFGAGWISNKPIIPLCHSGAEWSKLIPPLNNFQGCEASSDGLRKLYVSIAGTLGTGRVLEEALLADAVSEFDAAEKDFRESESFQFERYLDILIPAPGKLSSAIIPDDTPVESNADTLSIFGILSSTGKKRWCDIKSAAEEISIDRRWLFDLQKCVHLASVSRKFDPIQAIFHGPEGSFQPQLSRKDILPNGSCRFHVHMVETVVAPTEPIPTDLGLLATLIRFGLRFRYEVVEPFLEKLDYIGPSDLSIVRARLRHAVETIETDLKSRGAPEADLATVAGLFVLPHQKQLLVELSHTWGADRSILFDDSAMMTREDLCGVVESMRQMNGKFMKLASHRFHELTMECCD